MDTPGAVALAEKAIKKGEYLSVYYPSEYFQIYFISRFYRGSLRRDLIRQILARRDKTHIWDNPLYTAMMVSALIDLGGDIHDIEKGVRYIMRLKQFKPYPFCFDPSLEKGIHVAGSSELTAAFCVEALEKYRKLRNDAFDLKAETVRNAVIDRVRARFYHLEPKMRALADDAIERFSEWDARGNAVILLPRLFAQSLKEQIKHKFTLELSAANLFQWLAYKIYDDFLDKEGDGRLLGIANICLREFTEIYRHLMKDNFYYFTQVMDQVDEANTWEQLHCRLKIRNGVFQYQKLPRFGNHSVLAKKSFAHALGPITALLKIGFKIDSEEIQSISDFFENCIIARQLNDDMQDWFHDLERGFINPVSAQILEDFNRKQIDLNKDLPRLKSVFWHKSIDVICASIFSFIAKARMAIADLNIMGDKGYLDTILMPAEQAAREMLASRDDKLKELKIRTS